MAEIYEIVIDLPTGRVLEGQQAISGYLRSLEVDANRVRQTLGSLEFGSARGSADLDRQLNNINRSVAVLQRNFRAVREGIGGQPRPVLEAIFGGPEAAQALNRRLLTLQRTFRGITRDTNVVRSVSLEGFNRDVAGMATFQERQIQRLQEAWRRGADAIVSHVGRVSNAMRAAAGQGIRNFDRLAAGAAYLEQQTRRIQQQASGPRVITGGATAQNLLPSLTPLAREALTTPGRFVQGPDLVTTQIAAQQLEDLFQSPGIANVLRQYGFSDRNIADLRRGNVQGFSTRPRLFSRAAQEQSERQRSVNLSRGVAALSEGDAAALIHFLEQAEAVTRGSTAGIARPTPAASQEEFNRRATQARLNAIPDADADTRLIDAFNDAADAERARQLERAEQDLLDRTQPPATIASTLSPEARRRLGLGVQATTRVFDPGADELAQAVIGSGIGVRPGPTRISTETFIPSVISDADLDRIAGSARNADELRRLQTLIEGYRSVRELRGGAREIIGGALTAEQRRLQERNLERLATGDAPFDQLRVADRPTILGTLGRLTRARLTPSNEVYAGGQGGLYGFRDVDLDAFNREGGVLTSNIISRATLPDVITPAATARLPFGDANVRPGELIAIDRATGERILLDRGGNIRPSELGFRNDIQLGQRVSDALDRAAAESAYRNLLLQDPATSVPVALSRREAALLTARSRGRGQRIDTQGIYTGGSRRVLARPGEIEGFLDSRLLDELDAFRRAPRLAGGGGVILQGASLESRLQRALQLNEELFVDRAVNPAGSSFLRRAQEGQEQRLQDIDQERFQRDFDRRVRQGLTPIPGDGGFIGQNVLTQVSLGNVPRFRETTPYGRLIAGAENARRAAEQDTLRQLDEFLRGGGRFRDLGIRGDTFALSDLAGRGPAPFVPAGLLTQLPPEPRRLRSYARDLLTGRFTGRSIPGVDREVLDAAEAASANRGREAYFRRIQNLAARDRFTLFDPDALDPATGAAVAQIARQAAIQNAGRRFVDPDAIQIGSRPTNDEIRRAGAAVVPPGEQIARIEQRRVTAERRSADLSERSANETEQSLRNRAEIEAAERRRQEALAREENARIAAARSANEAEQARRQAAARAAQADRVGRTPGGGIGINVGPQAAGAQDAFAESAEQRRVRREAQSRARGGGDATKDTLIDGILRSGNLPLDESDRNRLRRLTRGDLLNLYQNPSIEQLNSLPGYRPRSVGRGRTTGSGGPVPPGGFGGGFFGGAAAGGYPGDDSYRRRIGRGGIGGAIANLGYNVASFAGFFALVGGLSASLSTLSEFEQAMATVRAVTQATQPEFAALTAETQRLGATTRFSAVEAAQGAVFLGRTGFTTSEVIATLEATLRLAQAGALDLARAADIATNVLKGFRLPVEDASRVVDVLARITTSSNTNIEQLGQAMKFVAPIAAEAGQSLELTAAAVGVLSDAGLQGSIAGTGLRRVLSGLVNPSTALQRELSKLGLGVDDVNPRLVGFSTALERINAAEIRTGETLQAITAFGQRGGPAFEVLSIDEIGLGVQRLRELEEQAIHSAGAARDLAQIMDDNLQGALKAVQARAEAVVISAGEAGLTGTLEGLSRDLAGFLQGLAEDGPGTLNHLQAIVNVLLALGGVGLARGIARLALSFTRGGPLIGGIIAAGAALTAYSDEITVTVQNGRRITAEDLGISAWHAIRDAIRDARDAAAGYSQTQPGGDPYAPSPVYNQQRLSRIDAAFLENFENLGRVPFIGRGLQTVAAVTNPVLAGRAIYNSLVDRAESRVRLNEARAGLDRTGTRLTGGIEDALRERASRALFGAEYGLQALRTGDAPQSLVELITTPAPRGLGLSLDDPRLAPYTADPRLFGDIPNLAQTFFGRDLAFRQLPEPFTSREAERVQFGLLEGIRGPGADQARPGGRSRFEDPRDFLTDAYAQALIRRDRSGRLGLQDDIEQATGQTLSGTGLTLRESIRRFAVGDRDIDVVAREIDSYNTATEAQQQIDEARVRQLEQLNDLERQRGVTLSTSNDVIRDGLAAGRDRIDQLQREIDILRQVPDTPEQIRGDRRTLRRLVTDGTITPGQARVTDEDLRIRELEAGISQGTTATPFADAFESQIRQSTDTLSGFRASAGRVFADVSLDISRSAGDAFGAWITQGESLTDALEQVAKQGVGAVISGLVDLAIQELLFANIRRARRAAEVAEVLAANGIIITSNTAAGASSVAGGAGLGIGGGIGALITANPLAAAAVAAAVVYGAYRSGRNRSRNTDPRPPSFRLVGEVPEAPDSYTPFPTQSPRISGDNGGRTVVVHLTQNIRTPDVEGFRRSRTQIARETERDIRRAAESV